MDLNTSKYSFSVAAEEQEPELRRMVRCHPMPGKISVSFEREPDYFYGASIGNKFRQVLVCNDPNGDIAGIGARSIFDACINGAPASCGYLSGLRIKRQYRNRTILARGYQFLHELHRDKRTKLYLTSILGDNHFAKRMLTNERAGLPFYRSYGMYHSYIVAVKNIKTSSEGVSIVRAKASDMPAAIEYLRRSATQKQFYPLYASENFQSENGFLRGFNFSDFFIAIRGNRLVGVMGMWDQRAFKQTVVRSYTPILSKVRPFYNQTVKFFGGVHLPAVGRELPMAYAVAIAIEDNEDNIFKALFEAVCGEAEKRHLDYLAIGLHERDSLCRTLKRFRHFLYKANLYVVHWEDGADDFKALDQRVPYLEIATL